MLLQFSARDDRKTMRFKQPGKLLPEMKWSAVLYVSALWQNPIWRSFRSPCRVTNQNQAC